MLVRFTDPRSQFTILPATIGYYNLRPLLIINTLLHTSKLCLHLFLIRIDFKVKYAAVDGKTYKLKLFDTAGTGDCEIYLLFCLY